ncbi:MAG: TIGR00730 family Rossman fold protein [Neptuniibacter sp.]
MKKVTVFCGSKMGAEPEYSVATEYFGSVLASQGYDLVYGGAKSGLMGVLADSVLKNGGKVTGVMPTSLQNKEQIHPNLSETIQVSDMSERKAAMLALADAFIALPGGTGTLDELFEVFTLSQIGEHHKPCGILNLQGYYDDLLGFLKQSRDKGFLHPDYFDMLIVDEDPESLLTKLSNFKHPHNR